MNNLPIIRLELEQMKYQILHAFGAHQHELSAQVTQELEKAINSFDYSATVSRIAHEIIKEQIESYFRYGAGRQAIETSVNDALDKVFVKTIT